LLELSDMHTQKRTSSIQETKKGKGGA